MSVVSSVLRLGATGTRFAALLASQHPFSLLFGVAISPEVVLDMHLALPAVSGLAKRVGSEQSTGGEAVAAGN